MNAPENCGRAPPQVCAGGVFGAQPVSAPPKHTSSARVGGSAAGPAARPSPCGNSAFIPNTFRIIQSNLYSFRQISRPLPFGGPASLAKARIHRAKFVQKAARPLLHRLCARPRNRGAAPSGLSYTNCILLSNYTSIRRNPPWLCDYKCHVPFPRCQNSAEQFSERKSKITSSTMVLRLRERKMPLSGKGSPVRLR